jgi:hypothetical protein
VSSFAGANFLVHVTRWCLHMLLAGRHHMPRRAACSGCLRISLLWSSGEQEIRRPRSHAQGTTHSGSSEAIRAHTWPTTSYDLVLLLGLLGHAGSKIQQGKEAEGARLRQAELMVAVRGEQDGKTDFGGIKTKHTTARGKPDGDDPSEVTPSTRFQTKLTSDTHMWALSLSPVSSECALMVSRMALLMISTFCTLAEACAVHSRLARKISRPLRHG